MLAKYLFIATKLMRKERDGGKSEKIHSREQGRQEVFLLDHFR
jgi:hypothetical protein